MPKPALIRKDLGILGGVVPNDGELQFGPDADFIVFFAHGYPNNTISKCFKPRN